MSIPPFQILLVFVGGGLGSVARYLTTVIALQLFGPQFPWGTFTVNVVGSALMGFLTALIVARWTFSAYSLDAFVLWERGQMTSAVVYVLSSVVVSFAVLAAAMLATRAALV